MKVLGYLLLAVSCLFTASWQLPQNPPAKELGSRTYRFTTSYTYSNTKGEIARRERITALCTWGPTGEVTWRDVSVSQANGKDAPFGPGEKREFMDNFRYRLANADDSLKPEFFKNFPPSAVAERNLVWDTLMFETFGRTELEHLKLNEPYHFAPSQNIALGGAGNFQNRDIELTWAGSSRRNGQDCALILYQAFFNPLHITVPGVDMIGRSHYWGSIWVSSATKQIEYATLYEDVLGELKLPNQNTPQIVDVFRDGVFEPFQQK